MSETTARYLKNLLTFLGGLLLALVLVEVVLQVHNPFRFRVRGDEIVLPSNRRYTIEGVKALGIDTHVVHTKNSIGFRGTEPPSNFEDHLTLISVGGSTTECLYLSDGEHWTARLGNRLNNHFQSIWWNNAGLAGQSTYGHILLINDYLSEIKPDYALFLIGINDVGRRAPGDFYEAVTRNGPDFSSWRGVINTMEEYSEVVSLMENAVRSIKAKRRGLRPMMFDPTEKDTREVSDERLNRKLIKHERQWVPPFRRRVETIVEDSRKHGIEPILVTQPAFFGSGVDPTTGVRLDQLEYRNLNGRSMWQILELYNDATRSVAKKKDVKLVDLARSLPKDWKYFHDFMHFTKPGARKIESILFEELCPYFSRRHPKYQVEACLSG